MTVNIGPDYDPSGPRWVVRAQLPDPGICMHCGRPASEHGHGPFSCRPVKASRPMTTIARTRQWADRLQLLGWILALAGPAAGFLLAAYTPEPHRQPYVLAGILIALAGLAAGVLVGAFSQVLRALAEISEQERERSRTP